MAGLQLLKHTFNLSDEQVVTRWTENPYWQFFCGEEFFRHSLPIHPCQMTRWWQRIGEKGVEKLLQNTIEAGKATRTITERSLKKVIVDTTVQPKASSIQRMRGCIARSTRRCCGSRKRKGWSFGRATGSGWHGPSRSTVTARRPSSSSALGRA